jgi:hypothetical protein
MSSPWVDQNYSRVQYLAIVLATFGLSDFRYQMRAVQTNVISGYILTDFEAKLLDYWLRSLNIGRVL